MSIKVRDGNLDVVLAPAPHLPLWPSAGAVELSRLCSDAGLSVGILGENGLQVRGVIPNTDTGGVVIAQDVQGRVHRIRSRAVIRYSERPEFCDPFPGWRSQGLIPYSTARKLLASDSIRFDQAAVILGSGNRALRLGSRLLESGVKEVIALEQNPLLWQSKGFAGWEVEKRRFESLGGLVLVGKPLSLQEKGGLLWDLRIQDDLGVRVVSVSRVVSVGPFSHVLPFREFPQGSQLYEITQSALHTKEQDVEGWDLELQTSRLIASRIVKSLLFHLGDHRDKMDSIYRKSRSMLKSRDQHRDHPFLSEHQGKWLSRGTLNAIQSSAGMPKRLHQQGMMAGIECMEEISCRVCEEKCPEQAIQIRKTEKGIVERVLIEDKCTACGVCVKACPSQAIVMFHEPKDQTEARMVLPTQQTVAAASTPGAMVHLLNRKGEKMGQGRVVTEMKTDVDEQYPDRRLIEIQLPAHLLLEIRQFKIPSQERDWVKEPLMSPSQVELILDGNKRRVRDNISVSRALFELGLARSQDVLFCEDGSCRLCQIKVDGVKRLACQTKVHQGMNIQLKKSLDSGLEDSNVLCACLGISKEQVEARIENGMLTSPERIRSSTHIGEGRCHGQICMPIFVRLLQEKGVDGSRWVDWRFPWSEWVVSSGAAAL